MGKKVKEIEISIIFTKWKSRNNSINKKTHTHTFWAKQNSLKWTTQCGTPHVNAFRLSRSKWLQHINSNFGEYFAMVSLFGKYWKFAWYSGSNTKVKQGQYFASIKIQTNDTKFGVYDSCFVGSSYTELRFDLGTKNLKFALVSNFEARSCFAKIW